MVDSDNSDDSGDSDDEEDEDPVEEVRLPVFLPSPAPSAKG